MGDALCGVPGCGASANLFGPTRRRCLAQATAEHYPALRSDVPAGLAVLPGGCTCAPVDGRHTIVCPAARRSFEDEAAGYSLGWEHADRKGRTRGAALVMRGGGAAQT